MPLVVVQVNKFFVQIPEIVSSPYLFKNFINLSG
jgi:hypothetical protein